MVHSRKTCRGTLVSKSRCLTFMSQWYTVEAVTRPSFDGVIHFQNTTGCAIWKLFILDFISKLKICRLSPVAPATDAFSAITLEAGFISAESAVMGRFRGVSGEARSTITTEFDGPVSRMQINLSLSMVTLVKEMNCWLMPRLGSCTEQFPVIISHATSPIWPQGQHGSAGNAGTAHSKGACGAIRRS